MGLTEIFIRAFGNSTKKPAPTENVTFRPRPGYEDLYAFLTDKKTEAQPKPQR